MQPAHFSIFFTVVASSQIFPRRKGNAFFVLQLFLHFPACFFAPQYKKNMPENKEYRL
jgi:hypothetical protein